MKIVRILLGFLFLFSCASAGVIFYLFQKDWVDISTIEYHNPGKGSVVLDADGNVFARFNRDKRKFVSFDQLPSVLINAFVAAEDHGFFAHGGISLRGMLRSFFVNLAHGRVVQGASTITQQLVKLLFLTYDRTFIRKFQEVFLALQLERQLTKEQIFETYLNNIYFGRGIYGVEAACQRFWHKAVFDITLPQAATLAAVAKSAYWYSPLNHPEKAIDRRNMILTTMRDLSFIAETPYQIAMHTNMVLHDHMQGNGMRLYIQEWVRTWAEQKWGRDALYHKGLKIQTTINLQMQDVAEQSFEPVIKRWREKLGDSLNGGMLSVESHSGKIRAMIGGLDFQQSQFNRAFHAVRQTGSSFKPIVYAAAIQQGISLRSLCVDEPIRVEMDAGQKWQPRNWHHRFDGPMTLIKGLTTSSNIVTIKTLLHIGYEPVITLAKEAGITREIHKYPSLALGTAEATVEENVAAFNIFANHGYYVKPYMIEWVKDASGNKMWQNTPYTKRVLDSKTNSKVVGALAVRMQKAQKLSLEDDWIDAESIGKTGSTNNSATTWFVGATPELSTAVYVGRDDNKGMGANVYGSQTSYPIWLEYNKRLRFKKKQFYYDPALKEVSINWLTGENAKGDGIEIVTILEEPEEKRKSKRRFY